MPIQLINLSTPNDGLGDKLRAGGQKINDSLTFLDTNKQPISGSLTSISGLAGTAGLLRKTGADTYTLDTNSYLTTSGKAADSELLDGLNSTQFLRADQSGTLTGSLTATSFKVGLFEFVLNGPTSLELRYNGVVQFKFSSTGELLVNDKAGEF